MRSQTPRDATRLGRPLGQGIPLTPAPLGWPGSITNFVLMLIGAGGAQVFSAFGRLDLLGWLLLSVGAGALLVFVVRRTARQTVTLCEKGLVISRFGRERDVVLDDIVSIAASGSSNHESRIKGFTTHRLRLTTPETSAALAYRVPGGAGDPLAGFVDSVVTHLAGRAASRGSVRGPEWALEGDVLVARGAVRIPLASITNFAWLGAALALWKGDESLPFLRVEAGGANARVLAEVLRQRIPPDSGRAAKGLGRLLHERGPESDGIAVRIVLSAMLSFFWWVAWMVGARWGSLVLALPFAWLVFSVFRLARQRARIYEHGFEVRGAKGSRAIAFGDVERLAFSRVNRYSNGIYAGTTLSVVMTSAAGGPALIYDTTCREEIPAFDDMRDRISALVGSKLWERMAREGRVEWMPKAWLTEGGLLVEAGKGKTRELPYGTFATGFADGQLEVTPSDEEVFVRLPTGAANFFPGYSLFLKLSEPAAHN